MHVFKCTRKYEKIKMVDRSYEIIVVNSLTRSLRRILLRTFLFHDTGLYRTLLISTYLLYRTFIFEKFVKYITIILIRVRLKPINTYDIKYP